VAVAKDWADFGYLLFSFLLVIVGGLQALLLFWTLQAVNTNAQAAKQSADALINAERPWVIPNVQTRMGRNMAEHPSFIFSITNQGRTPAEILTIQGERHLTDKGIDGGLEGQPDYGVQAGFMQVRMLAPQERWDYRNVNLSPYDFDSQTMKDIHESASQHVLFRGYILYRDVFRPDQTHETWFCYTFNKLLLEYLPSGPRAYTKYT
jgi:hypothetical protein